MAESNNATKPETCGEAMLVPDSREYSSPTSGPSIVLVARSDSTSTPGAATDSTSP